MNKNTKSVKTTVKREPKAAAAKTAAAVKPIVQEIIKSVAETAAPQKRSNQVSLEFVHPGANQVCVAGTFNAWKPEVAPLKNVGSGRWVGSLELTPGRHEYLFVVDGKWIPDPNATEAVQNPYGGKNSVLLVK